MAKAEKRARVLRGLEIHEVSSVDKGAGIGTRIMLLKREGGSDMDTMKAMKKAARKVRKAAERNDPDRIERREIKAAEKIVKAMDGAIARAQQVDPRISRDVALGRVAASRENAGLWKQYRAATEKLGGGDLPFRSSNGDLNRVPSQQIEVVNLKPQPVVDATADALRTLEAMVDGYVKDHPGIGLPAAYAKVMATAQGVAAYRREKESRLYDSAVATGTVRVVA